MLVLNCSGDRYRNLLALNRTLFPVGPWFLIRPRIHRASVGLRLSPLLRFLAALERCKSVAPRAGRTIGRRYDYLPFLALAFAHRAF